MQSINSSKASKVDRCLHCNTTLSSWQKSSGYCCKGCAAAKKYIEQLGLTDFYELLSSQNITPAATFAEDLLGIYDQEEFQKLFCHTTADSAMRAEILISPLSCYACVWLIQKAFEKNNFGEIEINLSSGQASIYWNATKEKLSSRIKLIQNLGFEVQIDRRDIKDKSSYGELIKLGVSFFCMMNIMLVSVPEYSAGKDLYNDFVLWNVFRYIAAGLCTIVMLYPAQFFYQTAWRSIKQKSLSIDQPIILALFIVFLYSLYNTFLQAGDIYFDSIASVVSLLLAARLWQKSMLKRVESKVRQRWDISLEYVRSIEGKMIPLSSLLPKQGCLSLPGEIIPLRCRVIAGQGELDYEQTTGEAEPKLISQGGIIEAGARNLNARLELEALESGTESVMFKTEQTIQKMLVSRGLYVNASDTLASAFFIVVLFAVVATLLTVWPQSPSEAINRTVAILLITCPCAFGVAVPLTMSFACSTALSHGIAIRSHRAMEKLSKVKRIFFDKTGTLTDGFVSVLFAKKLEQNANDTVIAEALAQLETYSNHHHARALSRWASDEFFQKHEKRVIEPIGNFKEKLGSGIDFDYKNHYFRIGSADYIFNGVKNTEVADTFLSVDQKVVYSFVLGDHDLDVAPDLLSRLKQEGYEVQLVSGDQYEKTQRFGERNGFTKAQIAAEKKPQEKASIIRDTARANRVDSILKIFAPTTAMVGNGFNDSLAFGEADLGIAVRGAASVPRNFSDVYLYRDGVSSLPLAFKIAKRAKFKIITAFFFACTYNTIGITLSALGFMSPYLAALFMPLSSLAVILITTKWKIDVGSSMNKTQNIKMKINETEVMEV
ncbi:MAG: heavy metal translocating P-type ATPase metal-binding domain-containing protein [Oligoflexales bacterium]|nr:heavy metal translocating P-type ATPase metal-binding domain-containing protein [Oligoflexales bacterium]